MDQLKYVSLFLLVALVSSCAKDAGEVSATQAMKDFKHAINGEWAMQPEEDNLEIWSESESGMIGRGLAVNAANDSTITEVYFLEMVNDSLRLQVQPVSDGGIGQEIDYYLTEHSKKKFVFENERHNFPKKIIYLAEKNGYQVLLEGDIGGVHQQADLTYKKQSK